MTDVHEFPREWYGFITTQKFNLRSLNQAAPLPWSGVGQAIMGPFAQAWLCDVTMDAAEPQVMHAVHSAAVDTFNQSCGKRS